MPRPGLHTFIEFCIENFDRIALLTTVDEPDARDVLYSLADSGAIPEEFTTVEYIHWQGQYKDLGCAKDISTDEILFVDDDENWIHPDQTNQWIAISHGMATLKTKNYPESNMRYANDSGMNRLDNNTLHTEPRAARLLKTMSFAAAR